ncbi:MAG TPA: NAD(P)/FAD-dependent oxidoreductase [Hyphomonadaceae bacterium]|nr:NAD(P)/FAD-dependent oxidoreductase [Hyphomonadaceae bacterium]
MAKVSEKVDIAIVGAGFSGLYMLHKARQLGLSARVFEAGDGVGGTWYWNRYPGARVDVESHEYSYSFSPELEETWKWSERYAAQPELLRYLNHVADRFDLRRDISLNTRVTEAAFDEAAHRWTLKTGKGDVVSARYCVMATGCLSAPKQIDIPGASEFKGEVYNTTDWPREKVNFKGKRVGVIGTGSSAVQTITEIAPEVGSLHVFQRTPCFSLPAHNGPANPEVVRNWLANREANRQAERANPIGIVAAVVSDKLALDTAPEERRRVFEDRWKKGGFAVGGAFADMLIAREANNTFVEFLADKVRGIVKDPETAEKLIPRTYPAGSKRICVDTGYFEVYNRPNVKLVDVSASPVTVTPKGVRTGDKEYEFDTIIFALGFDAMTGALSRIDIRGRNGETLKEKWDGGPRTYLGLMVAGFPNLFIVTGPGSPSVLSNMIVSIEQHVDWIGDCIAAMGQRQMDAIEATQAAEDGWVAHVNEVANMTLYPQANSWYMGANVPGKPRVFMPYPGGVDIYRQACSEIAADNYRGFAMSSSAQT